MRFFLQILPGIVHCLFRKYALACSLCITSPLLVFENFASGHSLEESPGSQAELLPAGQWRWPRITCGLTHGSVLASPPALGEF